MAVCQKNRFIQIKGFISFTIGEKWKLTLLYSIWYNDITSRVARHAITWQSCFYMHSLKSTIPCQHTHMPCEYKVCVRFKLSGIWGKERGLLSCNYVNNRNPLGIPLKYQTNFFYLNFVVNLSEGLYLLPKLKVPKCIFFLLIKSNSFVSSNVFYLSMIRN